MKKLLFAIAAYTCCISATAQAPSFITDSLDNYIKRGMEQWQIPGLAIAIVKDGKVVTMKGYGVKNIQTKEKVDENTLFIIASNSKLFTGTAIAKLEHEGMLSLNDKVTRYIPWFRMYDSTSTALATVRDMLSHRLGTKTFQGDFTFWDSNLPKDSIVYKMRYLKPNGVFRQDYGYCNAGFLVAGQILTQVTGQTWEDYVSENILKPAGMNNTYMNTAGMDKKTNVATPYNNLYAPLQAIPYDNVDNLGPATSMVSNVNDLSKWLMLQLDSGKLNNRQILPWEVLQKTRDGNIVVGSRKSPYYPTHFRTYGLGVFATDYNGSQVYWHTGGAFGNVTNVCFVPEEKLGITILTNNDNQSFFEALRLQILDAYLKVAYTDRSRFMYSFYQQQKTKTTASLNTLAKRVAANNKPPISMEAYEGVYYNTLYGNITLKKSGAQQLTVSFQHHPHMTAKLEYMDNNEFRLTYSHAAYGVFSSKISLANNKPQNIEIWMTDFIESDGYVFDKVQ